MHKQLIVLGLFFVFRQSFSQVTNTGVMDTTGGIGIKQLSIGGYIDLYYGGSFSKLSGNNIPYFVSMNRSNEATINLMYLDLRYHTKNFRSRLVPGFGTYVNANYANEPGSLRNILEASAGFKVSKKKEIWIDAGIFGSPYSSESAISKDQMMYTRCLATENVPYYLSGVKISTALNKKITAYFYIINGWQQIQDNNSAKSIGTQIEFRPNDYHLINWNTYIGDEKSSVNPSLGMRYFTDLYWIYSKNKISATACIYVGNQQNNLDNNVLGNRIWWQGNLIGKYAFTKKISLAARAEYFNDDNNVQLVSINGLNGFRTYSASQGCNYIINENALFRLEGRQFYANQNHYSDQIGIPSKNMTWLISNITVWF